MPLPRVFLDFTYADKPVGRVVLELFTDVVPKTAENFRALCTGEKSTPSKQLSYNGSPVHRIIEGFMIQGGDFTKRNGTGGESIYGGTFDDERLSGEGTEVDSKGLLVMANRGPNTNGSQWFITLAPAQHLTGKHVVFGRVVGGMEHIDAIGVLPTDERDRPLQPVIVAKAGELELRRAAVPEATRSRSRSRSITPESDSEDERERRRRREKRERKERERDERRDEKRRSSRKDRGGDDSRDRSRSPDRARGGDDEGRDREERKSKRDKKTSSRRRDRSPSETLSELDERLLKEENERLEVEKREQLAEMKRKIEEDRQAIKDAGGVVYKGRGSMRYRDPESRSHSNFGMPRNYDSRAPDTRARYRRNDRNDDNTRGSGRWERGGEAQRPSFERERRDDRPRDADRWDHGGFRKDRTGDRGRDDGGLAGRLGDRLPYDDEAEDRARDDPSRSARADAWRSTRRSPVPHSPPAPRSTQRSPSPGPVREQRSTSLERRDAGSDMEMDD